MTLPLSGNPRAKMQGVRDGFVKLFARPGTGIVVGGVVVGAARLRADPPGRDRGGQRPDRRPARARVHGLPVDERLGRRGGPPAAPLQDLTARCSEVAAAEVARRRSPKPPPPKSPSRSAVTARRSRTAAAVAVAASRRRSRHRRRRSRRRRRRRRRHRSRRRRVVVDPPSKAPPPPPQPGASIEPSRNAGQQARRGVAAEVARRPRGSRPARPASRAPGRRPGGTVRMSGSAPCGDPVGVGGADRHLALLAAGRRPLDVGGRGAVRRVEEARRAPGRQRLARDPGAHAGHRVAAVLERLGDVPDLLGPGHPAPATPWRTRRSRARAGSPGGWPRRAVVGEQVGVEPLQLLAEAGDVLVGDPADRVEVGGPPLLEGLAAGCSGETERETSTTAPTTSSRISRSVMGRGYPAAQVSVRHHESELAQCSSNSERSADWFTRFVPRRTATRHDSRTYAPVLPAATVTRRPDAVSAALARLRGGAASPCVAAGLAPSARPARRLERQPVLPGPGRAGTFTLRGHGFGHGHGMSQYGA